MEPNDQDLVRSARRGDRSAFHKLVDRHGKFLFKVAVSLVGNAADAEDIVQETFTGAFRGLKGFKGHSSVKTWLTRILFRQAAGYMRRRGRMISFLRAKSQSDWPAAPAASQSADVRMDVSAAILALGPEHRAVVVLRELEGMSYEEIAEILSIPRGTVESRLFRARRALAELLKDYFA